MPNRPEHGGVTAPPSLASRPESKTNRPAFTAWARIETESKTNQKRERRKMSAYIVDKEHILYLVQAAMSNTIARSFGVSWVWNRNEQAGTYERNEIRQTQYDKAADVANMLWRENIKSVSYRYPGDKTSGTLPGPVGGSLIVTKRDFLHPFNRFDPVQVLKSVSCYEYQTCEHPEWESSEAFAFCQALRHAAIDALPGYDAAEWGAPKTPKQEGVCLTALMR